METSFRSDPVVTDLPAFWSKRIRGVRRFVNAGWVVDSALPNIFIASVVAMAAILLARQQNWDPRLLITVAGALVVLVGVWSFLRARRHFISPAEARAKVDHALGLHTRLTAAAEGVGRWPEPERWKGGFWKWNWRRLLILPACSAGIIIAACLLPILVTPAAKPPPTAKPPALEKVEDWLQLLAKTPQIEQESVEPLKEEAEQLARQDPADWYSHASLEAADHLKAKMQAGLKTLGDNATKLESLLGQSASEAGASWDEGLQQALGALQGNIPGLNSELAKRLAGLDASKFKSLSPEQIQELKKELSALKGVCKNPGAGDESTEGEPDEEEGSKGLGNGGVDRGPGTGPLKFGDQPVNLGSKETESVENADLSRAALGDALGTSTGQHDVDRTKEHRAASGGDVAGGEGAGAVWQQQNLTPEERKRLQQFFK